MDLSEHPRLYNASSKSSIEINNNPFTIGRGLNCDYVITNQVISRLHCQLEKNGNQWFLRDKSTNGTYVNGEVIKSTLSEPLKDSDVIQLCQDNFKYYFQFTPTDDISDEQLCMLADSVFNNIEVNNPSVSGSTSNNHIFCISDSVDDDVLSVSVESVEETASPAILVTGAQPTKKIKIVDPSSSVVDLTGDISVDNAIPSTSSDTNNEPITINDSFQIVPSTTSDLKMVIQKVSIGKDPLKVKSEKASTSTAATMGQSVSQTREGNEYINDGQMDDELLCAICSEMFVKATTLNCSHTFCKYCIDTWKTKQTFCPICRSKITSQVPTLVLDNVIDKVIQSSSLDIKERRKELLEERNNTVKKKSTTKNVEGVGIVVEVESTPVDSSSDTSTLSETSEDEEDWQMEYWNDDWYNRRADAYYGGYGRCFTCGRRGHWANGCPNR